MLHLADILTQNILLHPFVALKRTCQVNRGCSPFICIQPFTLAPFLYHKQRHQGFTGLYKGLSSELLVNGILLGTETAIANYAEWPKEIGKKHYVEDSLKVLALRGISVALIAPFICSAVIETVQSVIVVNDRPSFVDCLKDGLIRLVHLRSTPSVRMLPIWMIVVPTVVYHVSHLAIWHAVKNSINFLKKTYLSKISKSTPQTTATRRNQQDSTISKSIFANTTTPMQNRHSSIWPQGDNTLTNESTLSDSSVSHHNAGERSLLDLVDIEKDSEQISSSILAGFITSVVLLPFEQVLNSLYVQGTRTIIDNCDETTVVLPVLTNYEGFTDCYQSIIRFEGHLGLYKGLGAVILQYSFHYIIFRSLYFLLKEFQSNYSIDPSHTRPTSRMFSRIQQTNEVQQQSITALNNTTTNKTLGNIGRRQDIQDEFMRLIGESNRHSTPNNPINVDTEHSRFNETTYASATTPTRFDGTPRSRLKSPPEVGE